MLRTGASFSALRGLGRCGPAAAAAAWASHQQRWVGGSAAAQAAQPLPAHDESADAAPHGAVSALLLDAAGTLIIPSESVGAAYSRYAAAHGFSVGSEMEVVQRFRVAYNAPPVPQPSYGGGVQQAGPLRYNGDARDFWSRVVTVSTGVDHPALAEDLYQYYTRPEAWRLADGALPALQRLKRAGLKTACVSNFDTRLRPILESLGVSHLFDAIIVSAEVGVEKPCRVIYEHALHELGVDAADALHVGDDRRNDVWGARDAGVTAWLWGVDVVSFTQLADRLLSGGCLWGMREEEEGEG